MLLNLREYHRPGEGAAAGRQRERLGRVLALLERDRVPTRVLAGGDTLLACSDPSVEAVVDLQGLGLDRIKVDGGVLRIGALVTRAIVAHLGDQAQTPDMDIRALGDMGRLLAKGGRTWSGSAQRNRATVGGAVAVGASNDPLLVTLLACDAAVALYTEEGSQQAPLADFLAHKAEWLAAPAVITDVLVPLPGRASPPAGAGFVSVGRTPADTPIVVAAAMLNLHDGHCQTVRLALGGVTHYPERVQAIERWLAGRVPEDSLLQVAAEKVGEAIQPSGDMRGSAEYRKAMAEVLTTRALREARARAQAISS